MNTNQEEKNENSLVDQNKDGAVNQDESKESSPFDSNEVLDGSQEEEKTDDAASGKQTKTMRTVVIAALLLLPIVYIFYKTSGNSGTANQPAADQATIDVGAYENAARSNPNYSNLLNLSNAYLHSGLAAKSIEPLKKAIELNPQGASAYNNLGVAYTSIGQFSKGIEYCEKAIAIDSSFQLAKNNLNWAKGEQNKILDANKQLEKTPEDKRDAAFYTIYGLNFLKLQDYDKSIEVFNKMLEMDPKSSVALINIGIAYMSIPKYDEAIKSFNKAIEFNSEDQLAKNNLAWALDEKKKAEAVNERNKVEQPETAVKTEKSKKNKASH